MARIQILPLPVEKLGAFEQTPFAVVIDGVEADSDFLSDLRECSEDIRDALGARAILSFSERVDVR